MMNKVIADRVEPASLRCKQGLGADTICRGNKRRMLHCLDAARIEDTRECSHARQHIAPLRSPYSIAHEPLSSIRGSDVYATCGVDTIRTKIFVHTLRHHSTTLSRFLAYS